MPTYTFQCQSCSATKDELIFSSKEEVYCDSCSSIMRSVFSPPTSFVKFNGEGWTKKEHYDSTSQLKDQAQLIKEDAKSIKSNELYSNTPTVKDIG